PDFLAGPRLIAHVDLASRIIAHQNHGQPRAYPAFRDQRLHTLPNFRADSFAHRFAVDHLTHEWGLKWAPPQVNGVLGERGPLFLVERFLQHPGHQPRREGEVIAVEDEVERDVRTDFEVFGDIILPAEPRDSDIAKPSAVESDPTANPGSN